MLFYTIYNPIIHIFATPHKPIVLCIVGESRVIWASAVEPPRFLANLKQNCGYDHTYRYKKKKKEYNEKGQYFVVTHFRKWNILYRFITQSEIFQAFISWNFDDYDFQIMKPKFGVSENLNIT